MIWTALQWIASAGFITGTLLIGRKKWYGWIFSMFGNVISGAIDIHLRLWGFMPVVLVSAYLIAAAGYTWYLERNHP